MIHCSYWFNYIKYSTNVVYYRYLKKSIGKVQFFLGTDEVSKKFSSCWIWYCTDVLLFCSRRNFVSYMYNLFLCICLNLCACDAAASTIYHGTCTSPDYMWQTLLDHVYKPEITYSKIETACNFFSWKKLSFNFLNGIKIICWIAQASCKVKSFIVYTQV